MSSLAMYSTFTYKCHRRVSDASTHTKHARKAQ